MARLDTEQRKRMIIQAALRIATETEDGLSKVNHSTVAKRCPIHTGKSTVKYYFAKQIDIQKACLEMNKDLLEQAVRLGVVDDN